MEIFDVIDKDGNPTGETNRHIRRASHTGQHISGFFEKKKGVYRYFFRNVL